MSKQFSIKVCRIMCATCPFRPGSPHANLVPHLAESSLTATRICHSTGNNPAIKRVAVKSMVCRGARDLQLQRMHRLGVIAEPTDAAWDAKCKELKIQPNLKR